MEVRGARPDAVERWGDVSAGIVDVVLGPVFGIPALAVGFAVLGREGAQAHRVGLDVLDSHQQLRITSVLAIGAVTLGADAAEMSLAVSGQISIDGVRILGGL